MVFKTIAQVSYKYAIFQFKGHHLETLEEQQWLEK